jgi:hypothetical protein
MSRVVEDEEITVWRNLARRLLDPRGHKVALGQ